MSSRKSPPASAPIVIKEGSVSVSIYPTFNRIYRTHPVTGQRELKSAHEQFTLAYYQGSKRVRKKFTDLAKAKLEAEAVVLKLANGETEALKLTGKDRACYVAATQDLHKWRADANLRLVVADYVAAARRLPENVPLQEAVNFYLKRHPAGLAQRTVRQVLDELVKSKSDAGKSEVYIKDLRGRVGHFADAFQVPITSVTGQQVDDYIRARGKAPRTQNNIRRLVATLFKFAVRRGYLPKDHDEMSAVEKAAEGGGDIEIFTPDELRKLFAVIQPGMTPYLPSL
ncbi:MAG: hypothetical protein K0Q55_2281 [Verrucomicrobia bacterium]|jgi:hypothetical protein|nr:hypothetical protein [Verrucomicrobiota bacterium]